MNNAYANAPRRCRAASVRAGGGGGGLWWFEEPLSPENVGGHAELAGRSRHRSRRGRSEQTRRVPGGSIESRAADILQPDVGVVGGVSEYLRVAHAAETFGLRSPRTGTPTSTFSWPPRRRELTIEYFELAKDIYNFEALLTEESRLRIEDGTIALGERPGIGIELDEAAVEQYAISREHREVGTLP